MASGFHAPSLLEMRRQITTGSSPKGAASTAPYVTCVVSNEEPGSGPGSSTFITTLLEILQIEGFTFPYHILLFSDPSRVFFPFGSDVQNRRNGPIMSQHVVAKPVFMRIRKDICARRVCRVQTRRGH